MYLLFVMKPTTRRVYFAGCTPNPNEDWMKQIARNLTDGFDGFLCDTRILLMDRDSKFSEGFRDLIDDEGTECLRLPARSPNLTPHDELDKSLS